MAKINLTDTACLRLSPIGGKRTRFFDTNRAAPSGFCLDLTPQGARTFSIYFRVKGSRKKRCLTIGQYPVWTLADARQEAAETLRLAGRGIDPKEERERREALRSGRRTVTAVLAAFTRRHVRKDAHLRSGMEIVRAFRLLVRPAIGKLYIGDLKRSHVAAMLDQIADTSGPVMADRVLAYVRKALNWYSLREDDFVSPIVPGMARTSGKGRARKRILDDDELRRLWDALDAAEPACYGRLLKALLLTGARLDELASARWDEISRGALIVPAARCKTKLDHAIPLTPAVSALMGKPKDGAGPFIFGRRDGHKPFRSFSTAKRRLDAACPMAEPWRTHDLRRVSRSLMSQAGVPSDHAERVLGHLPPGVRGVYDRYDYLAEKLAALEALAAMVGGIVNPPEPDRGNVRQLWG